MCKLLDLEKRQHNELKMTWQMANDQFLESQRLMMMDMRRMESVLSAEQQRQIHGERQHIEYTVTGAKRWSIGSIGHLMILAP